MRRRKGELLNDTEGVVSSKMIALNTVDFTLENEDRIIRYYDTDIITFKKNGNIILNSGGWRTVTTKARISKFSPFYITQKDYTWYVSVCNGVLATFYDGITFDKDRKEIING